MSLLKRIEQGQSNSNNNNASQPSGPSQPSDQASKLAELRMRRAAPPVPGAASGSSGVVDLKSRVQNKLLGQLDPSMDVSRTADVRRTIEDLYETILAEEGIVLSRAE